MRLLTKLFLIGVFGAFGFAAGGCDLGGDLGEIGAGDEFGEDVMEEDVMEEEYQEGELGE